MIPKSIEQILEEFETSCLFDSDMVDNEEEETERSKNWLRSAIASTILHAAEKTLEDLAYKGVPTDEFSHTAAWNVGRTKGINELYAALRAYAEKISNG